MVAEMVSPTPERAAQIEARVRRMDYLIRRVRDSEFIPIEPLETQWQFILNERREVLFGGGVGGSKSFALLAAALMWVDNPNYHALLLRKTYADLVKPKALMDIAAQWLGPTPASARNGGQEWKFPSGASLTFGHMSKLDDRFKYDGSGFQMIGWDEVQQIPEKSYRHLFSRLRQIQGTGIPLRMRATANPGGLPWVKERFVDPHDADTRAFIPSLMGDNPHLDLVEYAEMLSELDPVTRAQLQHGDWEARPLGGFFKPSMFVRVPRDAECRKTAGVLRVRAWDFAASADTGDFTVGVLVAYDTIEYRWRVEDVVRAQLGPDGVEQLLRTTTMTDPPGTVTVIEQEPGSSGKMAARDFRRRVLAGFPVRVVSPTGPKVERARLAANLLASGDFELVSGPFNADFTDELGAFGPDPKQYAYDDQCDGFAYACMTLQQMIGQESFADTSAVDTFRRMSVVTGDAARSPVPRPAVVFGGPPSSSPFGSTPFRR